MFFDKNFKAGFKSRRFDWAKIKLTFWNCSAPEVKIIDTATNRNSIKRAIVCEWSFQVLVLTPAIAWKKWLMCRESSQLLLNSHTFNIYTTSRYFVVRQILAQMLKRWYDKFTYNECYVCNNKDILSQKYIEILKYCSFRVSLALRGKVQQKSSYSLVKSVSECFLVALLLLFLYNFI